MILAYKIIIILTKITIIVLILFTIKIQSQSILYSTFLDLHIGHIHF